MAYAAVILDFFDNKKYLAAVEQDARAIPLYFWALAYANEELTDGFIPAIQVRRRIELGEPVAAAAVLVSSGLWEAVEGGYQIHDFLVHNLSAEQVREKRTLKTQRQLRWLHNKRDASLSEQETDPSFVIGATTPLSLDASKVSSNGVSKDAASASASASALRSLSKAAASTNGASPAVLPAGWVETFEDIYGSGRPSKTERAALLRWAQSESPPQNVAHLRQALERAKRNAKTNCIAYARTVEYTPEPERESWRDQLDKIRDLN